jgi:hypothetical protein
MVATTLGIDIASQDQKTAACLIRWDERVTIDVAHAGFSDEALAEAIRGAGKVGIDVPLGWPVRFVEALASYMAGAPWMPSHLNRDLSRSS